MTIFQKWGDPIRVTSLTNTQAVPDMVSLADGRFAVIWADTESDTANKLDRWRGYHFQILNADGTLAGGDFALLTGANHATNGLTLRPAFAGLQDGGMVTAFWDNGIKVQFRNLDGSLRSETAIAGGPNIDATVLSTGQTVVTFVSGGAVHARFFSASGVAEPSDVIVSSPLGFTVRDVTAVTALSGGRSAIIWSSSQNGGTDYPIHVTILGSNGATLVPAFTVDADRGLPWSAGDGPTIVELANGHIAAAWTSHDNSGWFVSVRLFDQNGVALGSEYRASSGSGVSPNLLALPDGGFILGWQMKYRVFDANGAASDFEVNITDSLFGQGGRFLFGESDMALLADGRVAVSWTGGGDIYTQILETRTAGVTLSGTALADHLIGTGYADTISGGDGADRLEGDASNDRLYGGAGNDILDGGGQNDLLDGGTGADTMYGRGGDDIYVIDNAGDVVVEVEGQGTDTIRSAMGINLLNYTSIEVAELTGNGDGTINGTGANDYLYGNAGENHLSGGAGNDLLDGGQGRDILYGGDGDDWLRGGANDDILFGGAGADTFDGGDGLDYADFSGSASGIRADLANVWAGQGEAAGDYFVNMDGIHGSAFADYLYGDEYSNYLNGNAGADFIEGRGGHDVINGGAGDDYINGGDGRNSLAGGEGNDYLVGGSDGDYLYGGEGNDRLEGGEGVDVLYGHGLGGDPSGRLDWAVYINAKSAVRVDLAGSIANWGEAIGDRFVGIDAVEGSQFDDTLFGDGFDNFLAGRGGADTLDGGAGDDWLTGDAGGDYFAFAPNGGHDVITDFEDNVDKIALRHWGFSSISEAVSIVSDLGNDLRFNFSDGSTLTILNIADFQQLSNDILIA